MDNNIPILVFGLDTPGNIIRAVSGEKIGTLVSSIKIEVYMIKDITQKLEEKMQKTISVLKGIYQL